MNRSPSDRHPAAHLNAEEPPTHVAREVEPHCVATTEMETEVGDDANQPVHFEDLVERCMGNRELALRLLGQSPSFLLNDMQALQRRDVLGDPHEVARIAHRLKGASANIGAHELCDLFARIEQLGHTGETAAMSDCRHEMEMRWTRFIECVTQLCGQHARAALTLGGF